MSGAGEAAGPITPACEQGDHDVCQCLRPGQDRSYAGLVIYFDQATGIIKGADRCTCPCHEASRHDESEPAVPSQPSTDVPERLGPG